MRAARALERLTSGFALAAPHRDDHYAHGLPVLPALAHVRDTPHRGAAAPGRAAHVDEDWQISSSGRGSPSAEARKRERRWIEMAGGEPDAQADVGAERDR